MGFFDFLFGKKEEVKVDSTLKVVAPVDGRILPLSEVPDETFARELLGKGLGIEPLKSGVVKAPVSGELVQLFETKHAFVVKAENGVEVLTHFGLNTVKLNGEGFKAIAKEGDKVKAGDPIVEFDYDFLKENADSIITPVVVLEPEEYNKVDVILSENSVAGSTEIIIVEK